MRPRAGYSVLARLKIVKREILKSRGTTCATLALRLEVSRSTIKRDIEFLRDSLGFRCDWDSVGRTWYVPEGVGKQILL